MAGEARDLRNVKVQIKGVEKVYEGRNGKTVALNGVDLDISAWWAPPAAASPPC